MGEGQSGKSLNVKVMSPNVCEPSNIFFPSYGALCECVLVVVGVGVSRGLPRSSFCFALHLTSTQNHTHLPDSASVLRLLLPALCMRTKPSLAEGCLTHMVALGL